MRLTPKQAAAVAALVSANPGEAVTIRTFAAGRDIAVAFSKKAYIIGGRGKVTQTK